MRLTRIMVTAVAATGSLAVAHASEPSSGTISKSSPKVEWGGTVAGSGVTNNAWAQDPTFECQAPSCDTFALKVADPGNITFTLIGFNENTLGGDPGCSIRVIKPDGEAELFTGTCGPKTAMKAVLKNAVAGDYAVDVANSHVISPESGTEDYKASASLPVTPATGPPSGPGATPAPAPAPASSPEVKLTVKAPKLSARKLRKSRRFAATLTSSGPLKNVNVLFVNKKKLLGSGRIASLDGTAKVTVKLKRKLKPGTYQLTAGGKDSQGRNSVASVRVKVRK